MFTIDFTQIVITALGVVGTVLAAFIAAWVQKEAASAGLTIDDQQRAALEGGAESAINVVLGKIKDGSLTITTKSQAVSEVANLLIQHYPDALAYFGLGTGTSELANFVEARLEKWGVMPAIAVAQASATTASPATAAPAATAPATATAAAAT